MVLAGKIKIVTHTFGNSKPLLTKLILDLCFPQTPLINLINSITPTSHEVLLFGESCTENVVRNCMHANEYE